MEKATGVRSQWQDRIPAVVASDGSARLQTVTREQNLRFYRLIEAFDELTGIPCLLNTSFNRDGEPIVCTPGDALRTFYSSGLDVLIMGSFLVEKPTE